MIAKFCSVVIESEGFNLTDSMCHLSWFNVNRKETEKLFKQNKNRKIFFKCDELCVFLWSQKKKKKNKHIASQFRRTFVCLLPSWDRLKREKEILRAKSACRRMKTTTMTMYGRIFKFIVINLLIISLGNNFAKARRSTRTPQLIEDDGVRQNNRSAGKRFVFIFIFVEIVCDSHRASIVGYSFVFHHVVVCYAI